MDQEKKNGGKQNGGKQNGGVPDSDSLEDMPRENLHLLLKTVDGINSSMELKSILDESMEATRLVMNSEASSLMLLDKESDELFVNIPTGPVKEDIRGKSIPKGKGIAGWVVENKRPYVTNDAENSEHFWGDLSKEFTTRNLICVPLINRSNEVIGVIQAVNRRKNEDFTPHDIPVFQSFASHVSAAIERARQFEKLHDRIKEKDAVIREIHHRIKENLDALMELVKRQQEGLEDEQSEDLLEIIYKRIESMSSLHDLLFEENLSDETELDTYLKQLSEKMEEILDSMHVRASVELTAEKVQVKSHQAYLCGLILNELLVHIYRHGFIEDEDDAKIRIDLSRTDNELQLDVSDEGISFRDEPSLEKQQSIGMWIVDVMLKKLDGSISKQRSGIRFSVTFPLNRS